VANYGGAIDQGTTSTRFIVFDRSGHLVSTAQKEHQQIYPHPGWVEHSPEEIWHNTREVIAEAMSKANLQPQDLAAVGITNQRETTIVWNRKTGKPLANALVWQDTRVADYVNEFAKSGGQDRFRSKTGLPLTTYFSGLKIRWILEHVKGARELAEAGDVIFGNIDTFLVWHLTGHRRRCPYHRRHERQPYAGYESRNTYLGPGDPRRVWNSGADAADDPFEQRNLRACNGTIH
jgi:glycerol kinase